MALEHHIAECWEIKPALGLLLAPFSPASKAKSTTQLILLLLPSGQDSVQGGDYTDVANGETETMNC